MTREFRHAVRSVPPLTLALMSRIKRTRVGPSVTTSTDSSPEPGRIFCLWMAISGGTSCGVRMMAGQPPSTTSPPAGHRKGEYGTQEHRNRSPETTATEFLKIGNLTAQENTVDSRYLVPVGSQNSRAQVRWLSHYLALPRECHDSRIQDHRPTLRHLQLSNITLSDNRGSLHTSTSHQRQITTSNIRF